MGNPAQGELTAKRVPKDVGTGATWSLAGPVLPLLEQTARRSRQSVCLLTLSRALISAVSNHMTAALPADAEGYPASPDVSC